MTLKKLNTFWTKSPSSIRWTLRVYDADIVFKFLYGLETLILTESDREKLDAFQFRGLRTIIGIKHSFWSRVTNKGIMIQANFRARLPPNKQIIKMSDRLIRKQITLFGHLLRAPLSDPLKACS
eukprot:15614203-Heterocapsa_arctica.AAC.1